MEDRHKPHTMEHKLLQAVATGDTDLLAQVLGLESAEQGDESCLKGVMAEGSSALHIAASRGDLVLVNMICTQDISLIMARNNFGDTPLICAARAGHVDVVDYLIEHALAKQETVDPVLRAKNSDGETAMHEAIRNGHMLVLQKLMLRDSTLAAVVDGNGVSPLYLAILYNRADMVDILIRESPDGLRSPASYWGPDGQTVMHVAVFVNKGTKRFCIQEISKCLQHWEPTLAEKVDKYRRTALHYAASAGDTGVVKLLLRKYGLFPVHTAAIAGNTNVIRKFMKICPSCDELLDNKRKNILHSAVDNGRVMLVWYICRNPKFLRMMNGRDDEGNTPLHLAVKHGHIAIFSLLMMDLRVNLGIINHKGLTPLDVALIETTCNYSFSSIRNSFISLCLQLCEAYSSPWPNLTDNPCFEDKEKESSFYTNVSECMLYISVLIAADSFAAAFTPPGGYIAEGVYAGRPVLGGYTEFSEYVTTNSMSFVFSTIATCLLVHASLTNICLRRRRYYLVFSAVLVHAAVLLMLTTFFNVVMLALDPTNSWEDYVVVKIIIALGFAIIYGTVILPVSILTVPVCFRVAMQLRRSKRPWQDMFKVVAAAIPLIYVVRAFIITVQSVVKSALPGGQEPRSWPVSVIQGDANSSYPT